MIQRHHRALIMLNGVLLSVLALAVLAPLGGAGAQPDTNRRGRGNYTMVGGEYTGGSANAIFIVDAQNQEMVAVFWSQSQKTLMPLGYRDLAEDARRLTPANKRK